MSNKIKYLSVISILVLSLLVLPFSVSAESYSFNISISKPEFLGSDVSYFEVLLEDREGRLYVEVYIFILNLAPGSISLESSMCLAIHDDYISYYLNQDGDTTDLSHYEVFKIDSINSVLSYIDRRDVIESVDGDSWHHINFDDTILCVNFYNFEIYGYVPHYIDSFTVNYSSDGLILDSLNLISRDVNGIYDYISLIFDYTEIISNNIDDYFYYLEELQFIEQILQNTHDMNQNLYDLTADTFGQLNRIERIISEFYNSDNYYEDENEPPAEIAPPRDDSTIQKIEAAEQDALGGLTQEEVKELADEALDPTSKAEEIGATEINVNNIAVANNLFTDMFGVLGGSWSTFFLLNLSVAFAAFLIGRRY